MYQWYVMKDKYMKINWPTLALKERKIKPTMRHHSLPTKITINIDKNKCQQE